MKSTPVIQRKLYDNTMVEKSSNDEIVSRLDDSFKSGTLFSRINAAVVSRLDARFKSGY